LQAGTGKDIVKSLVKKGLGQEVVQVRNNGVRRE
jgi:hypothetical protein